MNQKQIDKKVEKCAYIVSQLIIASFDLSKPSEQKKCFNYTNLQPLWAEENLKKPKGYKK